MKAFIYKTKFNDGRPDFWDVIAAYDIDQAERIATDVIREIDHSGYGCDAGAEIDQIHECATEINSLIAELSEAAEEREYAAY